MSSGEAKVEDGRVVREFVEELKLEVLIEHGRGERGRALLVRTRLRDGRREPDLNRRVPRARDQQERS